MEMRCMCPKAEFCDTSNQICTGLTHSKDEYDVYSNHQQYSNNNNLTTTLNKFVVECFACLGIHDLGKKQTRGLGLASDVNNIALANQKQASQLTTC